MLQYSQSTIVNSITNIATYGYILMSRKQTYLLHTFLAGVLACVFCLVVFQPVSAQEPIEENEQCLTCHNNPDIEIEFSDGSSRYGHVSGSTYNASVHGQEGMTCGGCHPDHQEYPHPEVTAAKSYAPDAHVVNSVTDAGKIKKSKAVGVVAQTTLNSDFFKKVVPVLLDKAETIEIHNTICHATRIRQEAIKKLAPKVDFVVVIGGKNSSNTRKLFEIASEKNPNTFLIEKCSDLHNLDFIDRVSFFKSVGITAGASTPPDEIERVKDFFNNIENIAKEIKNGRTKRTFQH